MIETNPDWQQLICSLVAKLGTKKAVADRTGISPTAIGELASDRTRQPHFDKGAKLLNLHNRLYGGSL